jgi:hypothetical protein
MVINFRVHGISRGARKLTQTPMLIKKKSNLEKKIRTEKNLLLGFTINCERMHNKKAYAVHLLISL